MVLQANLVQNMTSIFVPTTTEDYTFYTENDDWVQYKLNEVLVNLPGPNAYLTETNVS
jgi:hypothetical protein